jgi:hypothetical protein
MSWETALVICVVVICATLILAMLIGVAGKKGEGHGG